MNVDKIGNIINNKSITKPKKNKKMSSIFKVNKGKKDLKLYTPPQIQEDFMKSRQEKKFKSFVKKHMTKIQ